MKLTILKMTAALVISLFAVSAFASHGSQWGHKPPPQCPPVEPPLPICNLHIKKYGDFQMFVVSIQGKTFQEHETYEAAATQVFRLRQDRFCR